MEITDWKKFTLLVTGVKSYSIYITNVLTFLTLSNYLFYISGGGWAPRRTGVQKQPTGRNYADSYWRKILHINTNDWKKLPRLTTFDPTHCGRWTIFYWYSLQETDKFVDFSWHRIYDLWRNKETNRKFSFWVRVKWKTKHFAGFDLIR